MLKLFWIFIVGTTVIPVNKRFTDGSKHRNDGSSSIPPWNVSSVKHSEKDSINTGKLMFNYLVDKLQTDTGGSLPSDILDNMATTLTALDRRELSFSFEPGSTDAVWCPNSSYFEFLPVPVALLPLPTTGTTSAPSFSSSSPSSSSSSSSSSASSSSFRTFHLGNTSTYVEWYGDSCFPNMSATLQWVEGTNNTVQVTLSATSPATSPNCSALYTLATSFSTKFVFLSPASTTIVPGQTITSQALSLSSSPSIPYNTWENNAFASTNVTWQWRDELEARDVTVNGLSIYLLPCGLTGTLISVLETLGIFDPVPADMVENNIKFLEYRNVFPSPLPLYNRTVLPPAAVIASGDYFAILRLDALDPVIAWGTAGRTGHSAVAVWRGTDLFVVENIGQVDYFPPPYTVRATPYDEWLALAQQAGYHVALLPFSAAAAGGTFDENAFWSWFDTVEGTEYGYQVMLWCFFDTSSPFANLPQPIDTRFTAWFFNFLEETGLLGNTTTGVNVFSMMTSAANKRLNTSCLTWTCIIDTVNRNAEQQQLQLQRLLPQKGEHQQRDKQKNNGLISTIGELLAVPEQDEWLYGGNESMTCSQFAARVWQKGLQGSNPLWSQISTNEQTPKDNFQLAIFDTSGNRINTTTCPGGLMTGDGGARGTYCQLMGLYELPLIAYNTVPLYTHMNEKCVSQLPPHWPGYERCPPGNITCC